MVLLTVTPAAKDAIELYNRLGLRDEQPSGEPSLAAPAVGNPVAHGQLIDISRALKERQNKKGSEEEDDMTVDVRLDALLKGARVWTPPPKPKPEQTLEYKALMAKLREEEERRAYERMINPPLPTETSSQRFPNAYAADAFRAPPVPDEDDEVTYADINRQMALIINVLVSIIACSVAIWIAARHWSVPQRLALSMSGSGIVAVAEVAIYFGYINRIRDAKLKEAKKVERKEIVETWVIDGKDKKVASGGDADSMRYRKGKHR